MAQVAGRFRMKSIHTRLTLSFSLLIVCITIFVLSVAGIVFTNRFLEQKGRLVLEKMSIVTQEIERNIDACRQLFLTVRRDTVVRQYTEGGKTDYDTLVKRLAELSQPTYGAQRMILLSPTLEIMDPYYTIESLQNGFLMRSGISQMLKAGRDEMFSATHNLSSEILFDDYMQNYSISYVSTLRDQDFSVTGYCVLVASRTAFFRGKNDYMRSLFDETYVISRDGTAIYRVGGRTQENQAIAFAREGYFSNSTREKSGYTLFKQPVPTYPEWVVVGVISKATMRRDLYVIYSTFLLVGLLGVGIVVVLSHIISKKITEPIYEMKQAMAKFETGQVPEKLIPKTQDELGYLVNGFNKMLDDISRFVEAICHEQEETKRAEVSALKFQLESLQSQINPHFLYNTLNTVSYLALKNRDEDIRSLIQSLNLLLRSTLSNQDELITIRKEIGFLESYMSIQSYRFEHMARLICTVEEQAVSCTIPKLILQPLVENALLHGIFPKGQPGSVWVSIRCDGDRVHICVTDDGVGLNMDKIEKLDQKKRGFNGIGIANVNERLALYYGDESRLAFEARPGEGTTVRFSIARRVL